MDFFFHTCMETYFPNHIAIDSYGDIIGINYTLFGDVIFIVGVGTFLLDVVGDVKTTQLLVKIYINSNKPMDACLKRETPLGF